MHWLIDEASFNERLGKPVLLTAAISPNNVIVAKRPYLDSKQLNISIWTLDPCRPLVTTTYDYLGRDYKELQNILRVMFTYIQKKHLPSAFLTDFYPENTQETS